MTSFWEIEQAASKLRRQLQLARLPELKLLCLADFFKIADKAPTANIESYIREFLPAISEASFKANQAEFLPDEIDRLKRIPGILKIQPPEIITSGDYATLERLIEKLKVVSYEKASPISMLREQVCIRCIFVEYYPDLELDSRGRILNLFISASPLPSRIESDDVNVRNPVEKPDDRFLEQARRSVRAARDYLQREYGLSAKKHYRFDFAVDSTGARFTGDSLGVAFAVGAIAAVGKVEVFRKKISIPSTVAFSGALNADGKLAPIDSEALKLKIYRAFHSDLRHLIIPREHGVEALEYVKRLEKEATSRRLEIALADDLDHVMADPRLVPTERLSWSAYAGKKAFQARRSIWIEIPALIVLAAILFYLIAPPQWMPWFDDNPGYADVDIMNDRFMVFNSDSTLLWAIKSPCDIAGPGGYGVFDINGDGKNEVLFDNTTYDTCQDRGILKCYACDGELMFERFCPVPGQYPGDTAGVLYEGGNVQIRNISGNIIIITIVTQNNPSRAHLKLWNGRGDSLGWYVHSGAMVADIVSDVNNDNRDDLILRGINNRVKCAVLFALDLDSVFGVSPPYECSEYPQLKNVTRGSQIKYILFPKSDLGCLPGELPYGYNSGADTNVITFDDSSNLCVTIRESNRDRDSKIDYIFDKDLRILNARPNDNFWTRRNEYVSQGLLDSLDWDEYKSRLINAITYWTDSGWVTEGQLRAAETHPNQ